MMMRVLRCRPAATEMHERPPRKIRLAPSVSAAALRPSASRLEHIGLRERQNFVRGGRAPRCYRRSTALRPAVPVSRIAPCVFPPHQSGEKKMRVRKNSRLICLSRSCHPCRRRESFGNRPRTFLLHRMHHQRGRCRLESRMFRCERQGEQLMRPSTAGAGPAVHFGQADNRRAQNVR